ncbi:MAG: F0F1 ATP synthase subunit delta [Clostridia bacterium]|nr:F0F1 ATP synthase subunit delta [Clostridia bacterium]
MAELVALTYGKALFEVSKENNTVDRVLEEISFIKGAFEDEPNFFELYQSPRINTAEKKSILKKIFGGKLSSEVMNFLNVLLDKKRISSFLDISNEYIRLANLYKNIIGGTVYSAVELKDKQLSDIEEKLSTVTNQSVKLKVVVDPSIIGGLKVKIGDKVLDTTVQNKLKDLRETIDSIIV